MTHHTPTFFDVVYTSRIFREVETQDALSDLRNKTKPALNLLHGEHADALLVWLNRWGCRITKKTFPTLIPKLADWWQKWEGLLPQENLCELEDGALDVLRDAFDGLRGIPEFGPTTASKALFAACPNAAIPWDTPIQNEFGLAGGTKEQYGEMLVKSRAEARGLMKDAKRHKLTDIDAVISAAGSRAKTLPELLDQYHWVIITRGHKIPTCAELAQWSQWAGCTVVR